MVPKGLIGVVHLAPMPGDPLHTGDGFSGVLESAMRDAATLAEGGASGLIIENFGSVPFAKGTAGARLSPHAIATMARVADRCRERFEVSVGVNCLRNDAMSAVGIAAAVGADFVRVNVFTGAMLTDQGMIEGEAAACIRYRQSLGAERVAVLADVLVKHATPLAPVDVGDVARDAVHRGLADGLIVTGRATGAATDPDQLAAVRAAVPGVPIYVGSGLRPDNATDLLAVADGAIVGTWLKKGGEVRAPVDLERTRRMASYFS